MTSQEEHTDSSVIKVSQMGRIRRITFNRPQKLNAFTREMTEDFFSAIEDAVGDDGTHVIVLSGAGRAFSSGFDISDSSGGSDTSDAARDMTGNRQRVGRWLDLWSCPKPLIGQVHGYCLGMANEILACCDFALCGESTRIGMPEAREFALPPTLAFWPLRIGAARAKELLFTGRLIDGMEAVALGLAIEQTPDEDLSARVDEVAAAIAEVPIDRLSVVKQAVNSWDERMGLRAAALGGAEYHALFHQSSTWDAVRTGARSK
ncbi:MAG TPA: enoyl-CoA hydratase-related protein [Myxococcota bacterium]|nr:enoyl-CoA hydratase-related protein [Myxococcota bacterium]